MLILRRVPASKVESGEASVTDPKLGGEGVYSLWTAPQDSSEHFLENVDVSLLANAPAAETPDPILDERRRAFETPVDQEGLIRFIY